MSGADTLFELQHTGPTPVCWSYDMGAESTAGVVRTLLDPGFRPPELWDDLSNLIVLTAQYPVTAVTGASSPPRSRRSAGPRGGWRRGT